MNRFTNFVLWPVLAMALHGFSTFAQENLNTVRINHMYEWPDSRPTRALTRDGNLLYNSGYNYVGVFDVSNPADPQEISAIKWYEWDPSTPPPMTEYANDLLVKGDYLYAATRFHGLMIIDVSDSSEMKLVNFLDVPRQRINGIYLWKDYLYLTASNNYNGRDSIFVYDIAVGSSPVFVGQYRSPDSHSLTLTMWRGAPLAIVRDRLWLKWHWDTLFLADIETNGSLTFKRVYDLTHPGVFSMHASDTILFMGASFLNWSNPDSTFSGISISSIDEDDNLSILSYIKQEIPSEIQVSGNYLYSYNEYFDLLIYDISDPSKPTLAGRFNPVGLGGMIRMEIIGDYIYLASTDDWYGIIIVKFIPPSSSAPQLLAPALLSLSPAYPNPFSGSTTITYSLPAQQYISLEVYNTLGRKVQTLYSGISEPGTHNARLNASTLSAGMYQLVLRSGEGVKTQMVVVR